MSGRASAFGMGFFPAVHLFRLTAVFFAFSAVRAAAFFAVRFLFLVFQDGVKVYILVVNLVILIQAGVYFGEQLAALFLINRMTAVMTPITATIRAIRDKRVLFFIF